MYIHVANLGFLGSPLWHKNRSAESAPPSSNVTTGTVDFNTPVSESNINNNNALTNLQAALNEISLHFSAPTIRCLVPLRPYAPAHPHLRSFPNWAKPDLACISYQF